MALTALTVVETRADGSDNNGGGFDPSFGGTDYSQQAAAQVAFTDLVISSCPAPSAPTCTPATGGSLSAGTYGVVLTYFNNALGLESVVSGETSVTVSASGKITVTSPAAPPSPWNNAALNIVQYKVYMTTTPGSNWKFQTSLAQGSNAVLTAFNAGSASPTVGTLTYGLSSVAHSSLAAELGNTIKINSGTGFNFTLTNSIFQILAQNGTGYIMDRPLGTSGSTAGHGNLGGACQTPTFAMEHVVAGGIIHCRGAAGVMTFSSTTNAQSGTHMLFAANAGTNVNRIRLIGYNTVRGDGGQCSMKMNVAFTGNYFMFISANYWTISNLIIDCNSQCGYGVWTTGQGTILNNLVVKNCLIAHYGLNNQYSRAYGCEATGGNNSVTYDFQSNSGMYWVTNPDVTVENCLAHDAQNNGFVAANSAPLFSDCKAWNLGTGGKGCGFGLYGNSQPRMWNCISAYNAGAGLLIGRNASDGADPAIRKGCLFISNVGYGIDTAVTDYSAIGGWNFDGDLDNGFYGNAGPRRRVPTSTRDISLAGDPFVSGATGNFTLNSTIGTVLKGLTAYPLRYNDGSALTIAPSSDPAILNFDEVQFPTDIAEGAKFGPSFRTTISITGSGSEQRVAQWGSPLYKGEVGHNLKSITAAQTLLAFFLARQGRARGFRFKDWNDYNVTGEASVLITTTTFQIVRRYTSVVTVVRNIQKPVAGTISLTDNVGATVNPALYTVDTTTGIITFGVAPAYTPNVTCQFDVPVRFDTDEMPLELTSVSYRDWPSIPIVGVRY